MLSSLRRVLLLALAFTAASTVEAATTKPGGPDITQNPVSRTVTAGSSATFSVTATGKSPLKYQWQFKHGNISGATKSSYTISKAAPANAGAYDVVVSNSVSSNTSTVVQLTVNPGFAGKYNMVVVNYNPDDVQNMVRVSDGNSSGSALYGTATISGAGPFNLALNLKGYAGSETGQSSGGANAGSVSTQGVVTINDNQSNLSIHMVELSGGTPIGFIGFGTALPGTGIHSSFILALNATTTATTTLASAAGNYTVVIIAYNATAVANSNAALNDDAVEIGHETLSSNGKFSLTAAQYTTGGGDTLGTPQTITGTVTTAGVVTINGVKSTVVTKPAALNGQIIGFQGTYTTTDSGSPNHIIIGLKNTSVVPPL
jgi:hypothetical protein